MVFLVLKGCDFNDLAGKRLTFPATFFFILLFPCGSGHDSNENALWKSEEPATQPAIEPRRGAALYTQKKYMRQLHQILCNYQFTGSGF
jgi:hypothetical protein